MQILAVEVQKVAEWKEQVQRVELEQEEVVLQLEVVGQGQEELE